MRRKIFRRKIPVVLTEATIWHLNRMAEEREYGNQLGRVIDDLVRDKQLAERNRTE